MTRRYTVTDTEGDYGRTYAARPDGGRWALDEEDAAREWAEDVHADLDYPDELECIVTNPDGERFRVTVTTEQTVTFHAGSPEPLPEPASPADPMPTPGPSSVVAQAAGEGGDGGSSD